MEFRKYTFLRLQEDYLVRLETKENILLFNHAYIGENSSPPKTGLKMHQNYIQ